MIESKSVVDLLNTAYEQGITINLNKDKLNLSFGEDTAIDQNLLKLIKQNKPEIIEFLKHSRRKEEESNPFLQLDLLAQTNSKMPLSFAQERLWYIDKLMGSSQYHVPIIHHFDAQLNFEALSYAINEVVNRHEVLRSVVLEEGPESYQQVLEKDSWKLNTERLDVAISDEKLNELLNDYIKIPFDLSKDHKLRGKLFKLDDDQFILSLVFHHIAIDAWSLNLFNEEVMAIYEAKKEQRPLKLPPLQLQYADYASWQKKYFSDERLETELKFWEQQLEGLSRQNFPLDFKRSGGVDIKGQSLHFTLSEELSKKALDYCKKNGLTLYIFLCSVFKILLSKYSGGADICIGSSISNRNHKSLENLIGFFVNMIAVRSHIPEETSFQDFVRQFKHNLLELYEHQDTPFDKIVERVVNIRDARMNPLFQMIFVLQNTPTAINFNKKANEKNQPLKDEKPFREVQNNYQFSQFDLTMAFAEKGGLLYGEIGYSTKLFRKETIENIQNHYTQLLKSILNDPSQLIGDLDLLTKEDKQQQLVDFNNTAYPYPEDKTVASIFSEQANRYPNEIAIFCQNKKLTYQQLEEQSNQLAHYLIEQGVTIGDVVGLSLDRSLEMIIGLIGILKAGAVYLPINSNLPDERKQFVIKDTDLRFIICNTTGMMSFLGLEQMKLILLDEDVDMLSAYAKTKPALVFASTTPAYIMYTSGSTGIPKGVMINHQAITRLLFNNEFDFLSDQTVLYQYAPLSFDASTFEIWGALLKGGKLVIASPGQKSLEEIAADISAQHINTLWLTAGLFHLAVEHHPELFKEIKYLLSGGDSIKPSKINSLLNKFPELTFINGYGPTESTTFAVIKKISNVADVDPELNDIGKPIGNTKAYVLEWGSRKLLPIGVPGELCLSGPGLAIGYHNDEELSQLKFTKNPYAGGDYDRLYRTGDLVKWLPNGHIEFIGRKDNQLKIRGFRIEPGEIEAAIERSGLTHQNQVTIHEDDMGTKRLIAYVQLTGQDKDALKTYLKSELPEYMQPAAIICLDEFPLTINGKIDRQSLPAPDEQAFSKAEYESPATVVEQKVATIWENLLGQTRIGALDNFFDLGGHSLLAIKLLAEFKTVFGIQLNISDIFEFPELRNLAVLLETTQSEELPAIQKQNRPTDIPLTFAQERFWFIDQLEGSYHYHIPYVHWLDEKSAPEIIQFVLGEIIDRHEILRTVYYKNDNAAFQKVLSAGKWQLNVLSIPDSDWENNLHQYISDEIHKPFDLSSEHPLRATQFLNASGKSVLVMVIHHIATDGWSNNIFTREFRQLYEAKLNKEKINFKPLPIQYADFAIWQRQYITDEILENSLEYWKNKLSGLTKLSLPFDFERPVNRTYKGEHLSFSTDKQLTQKLLDLCQAQQATLYMTLLAAFKILLFKYTGQQDICVGSPIANREFKEIEDLIGLFVNSITLRTELDNNEPFNEYLEKVKETTIEAYEHKMVPFEKVVEVVDIERDTTGNPIYNVMFTLNNQVDSKEESHEHSDKIENNGQNGASDKQKGGYNISKFDLTIGAVQTNGIINFAIEYSTDLFKPETIERLKHHYLQLLKCIVHYPEIRISELDMLSAEEKHLMVHEYNQTTIAYNQKESLIAQFTRQVAQNPDSTALLFKGEKMSYHELHLTSNQLANYLIKNGIQQKDRIGLLANRGFDMMVSILGILKCGATYIPLNVDYPKERLQFILEDAEVNHLIYTADELLKKLASNSIKRTKLSAISSCSDAGTQLDISSSLPVYVMYTSGSTGKPKGILVSQKNILKLVFESRDIAVSEKDVILQWSNFSFDGSTYEIFGALLNGATLCLIEDEVVASPQKLAAVIQTKKVSVAFMTTALFNAFVDYGIEHINCLDKLLFGGELVSLPHVAKAVERLGSNKLFHVYGPTETTTFATCYPIQHGSGKTIPIGKPLSNTQIYILNESGQICGAGIPGEIYIGGDGVSLGYLNRAHLNQEKFVQLPFLEQSDKLYRTGDIANWNTNGDIEFIGRKDDQVKIRGNRIELGEIQAILSSCTLVRQSVVFVHTDNSNLGKQLVAYIVANENFNKEGIRKFLGKILPESMIPSIFVEVDQLPLTRNGKVDKRKLLNIDLTKFSKDAYVAPRNDMEQQLALVWQELLGIDSIGIYDNFFELGGHSLLAMRVIAAIRNKIGAEITIRDFFNAPQIADLGRYISSYGLNSELPAINKAIVATQFIPLSFAQERLWFMDQLGGSQEFHISSVFSMKSSVDHSLLEKAFKLLIDKHQTLRTVIRADQNQTFQEIRKVEDWKLQYTKLLDADESHIQQLISSVIVQPFDLSTDYMLRAHLVELDVDSYLLILVIHHIAADGWSLGILKADLSEFYHAVLAGKNIDRSPNSIQYTDYAIWQREHFSGSYLNDQLNWWTDKLKGVKPLNLPTDFSRPHVKSNKGASSSFVVDHNLTKDLKALCIQQECTLFMLLLAAFKVLLYRYSGQIDICVGTPVANRNRKELEPLVGFFINTIALRTNLKEDSLFTEYLDLVKSCSLDAIMHQEVPFEWIVEKVAQQRDQSRTPVFQVLFAFQNTPDTSSLALSDHVLSTRSVQHNTAQYDISLSVKENNGVLVANIEYSTDLFKDSTIQRFADMYLQLLSSIIKQPDLSIQELEILSTSHRRKLTDDFNRTEIPYPDQQTIEEIFIQTSHLFPNKTALICEDRETTYRELDIRTNQLAAYLIKQGVRKGEFVGICVERSQEMVIAMLSILKAGAIYVPLQPDLPKKRIQYIIENADLNQVVTSKQTEFLFLDWIGIVSVNISAANGTKFPVHLPKIDRSAQDPAYMMYTSGSSGHPKGVVIKHQSVARLLFNNEFEYYSDKTIGYQYAPIGFDASAVEIWGTLLKGGTLVIATNGQKSLEEISNDFLRYKVNTLFLTTGLFHLAVENHLEMFAPIRYLQSGGDSIKPVSILKLKKRYPDLVFMNGYGPTESTSCSTLKRVVDLDDIDLKVNNVGKPIGNTKVYILEWENLRLRPIGSPGELCIAGPGLAIHYHKAAELTTLKFVKNPYAAGDYDRIYRTGDQARWLPDGSIEFLGRVDNQVKIRGYRIETGEVEAAIERSGYTNQNVVIANRDSFGNNQLIAYVKSISKEDRIALKNYLKSTFPDYMVPAAIISVEEIKLTANGKVDRKALPKPDISSFQTSAFAPPVTEMEKKLAAYWEKLLNIKPIGLNDNFFDLGGHSLMAIRLLTEIKATLKVKLAISDIFGYPTLLELAQLVEKQEKTVLPLISKQERPEQIPMSFAQERMWFIDQLNGSTHYHIPYLRAFDNSLDVEALNYALRTMSNRHEILRTVFKTEGETTYQRILPENGWKLAYKTIEGAQDEENQLVTDEILKPFDLSKDYPIRATLFIKPDRTYSLVMVIHHIATDGWSHQIMIEELEELYVSRLTSRPHELTELKVQYADYSIWQNQHFSKVHLQPILKYWQEKLEGVNNLKLPFDFQRPRKRNHLGEVMAFEIDESTTKALALICTQEKVTMFMLLLTIFKVLLYRYSHQADICVGSPIANRDQKALESMIGFFVNTIALRSDLSSNPYFIHLLNQVKSSTLQAFDHKQVPFEKIVEALGQGRDTSISPVFQVVFTLNIEENKKSKDKQFSENNFYKIAKYDLTLAATETDGKLRCTFDYATDLFLPETIHRLKDHFIQLVAEVASNPHCKIDTFDFITPEERHTIVEVFNQTETEYPKHKTIDQIFYETAVKKPNKTALLFKGKAITYEEVNTKANAIAQYLIDQGVQQGEFVGVCLKKQPELIFSILGILKIGAVYLPLETDLPIHRIHYIVENANLKYLISEDELQYKFAEIKGLNIVPLSKLKKATATKSSLMLSDKHSSNDPAYMIYTSGSTGMPKGVVIKHQSVIRFLINEVFNFYSNETISYLFAPNGFDASLMEIFGPLLFGGTMVISERKQMSLGEIKNDITRYKINTLFLTAGLFHLGVENDPEIFESLKYIITGGDRINPVSIIKLKNKYEGITIVNGYGPTEAAMVATVNTITKKEAIRIDVDCIGKPLSNTKVYILEWQSNKLLPVGVPGELCIAGPSLAIGYHNAPELTSQKFIANPYGKGAYARLYRTGDAARWLADGTIEFLGRNDNQIKLRGYRIETGEIDAAIERSGYTTRSIVILHTDSQGVKRLIAYVKSVAAEDINRLKAFLKSTLPEYMQPSAIINLEHIPITQNGKVDRNALPAPDPSNFQTLEYVQAKNDLERKLVRVWEQVLGLEKIGVQDNFFDRGGHSLLSLKMIARIEQELQLKLSIKDFHENQTIASIARLFSQAENTEQQVLIPLNEILDDQQSLYMIPPILGNPMVYNEMAALLSIYQYNCFGFSYTKPGEAPFYTSIEEMAATFCNTILSHSPAVAETVTILGYSLGAIIAFELASQLEQQGIKCKLILLDSPVPTANKVIASETIIKGVVRSHLRQLDIKAEENWMYENLVKHYFQANNRYTRGDKTLSCPIIAIEGQQNAQHFMAAWRQFTTGQFSHSFLDADHFNFLNTRHLPELVKHLISK